ncbi:MAG: FG-GAP repeat protein, partial [Phycisphaerae bacterium]|nr:FG-GAP repeat protein [Phycisphaerae bacterium]
TVGLGTGGFAIHGTKASDFSGTSARGAGDVNGDGLQDVIVGAFGADPNGAASGAAYVIFGRGQGKPVNLAEVEQQLGGGFVMRGEKMIDFAGAAVAGAGDVNGDGLADVIVGAYGSDIKGDTSGRAYVVFGKTGVVPVELSAVAMGQGGFAIDGEKQYDKTGTTVGGVGDVNGDGLCDVIVASPRIDSVGEDAGRGYVVFGKQDGDLVDLTALTQGVGGFVIDGQQVRDYAGISVDGAGDVNGDGLD